MKPRKAVVDLLVTFIIGLIVFAVSLLLGLCILFGAFFKNVGATSFGIFPPILLVFSSCFFYVLELFILCNAQHVWGLSYIFIVMNAGCILIAYGISINSAIFTKKSIYRLTKFLTLEKHSYNNVIGYVMKKTSDVHYSKFGARTVLTYDVEIYLNNNKYISFSTKRDSDRKIKYIIQLLQDHHCHRNGRIPKKYRSPYISLS